MPTSGVVDIDNPGLLEDLEPRFIENLGQLGQGAGLYYATGEPLSVAFDRGTVTFVATDPRDTGAGGHAWRLTFPGSRDARPVGREPFATECSYFLGSDPSDWRTGGGTYAVIEYGDLYDGVDLVYRFEGGALKYDLVFEPGADPSSIRMHYEGNVALSIDRESGDLVVDTSVGRVVDGAPVAFQGNASVHCEFNLLDDSTVGFILDAYDPSEQLTIDPEVVWSTYLGGSDNEAYFSYGLDYFSRTHIDVDSHGNCIVSGYTSSRNFPVTTGSFNISYSGGDMDGFILKMRRDGTDLIWSTYLGGSDTDPLNDMAVDGNDDIYVCGYTLSKDFPTTSGAYDTYNHGGIHPDAFITKLAANGSALLYSSLLGGNSSDEAYGIVVNASGCAYVSGCTFGDFPSTPGCINTTSHRGFLTLLNETGESLVFSTFFGGTVGIYGFDIALDEGKDKVFVTGKTYASHYPRDIFPSTPGMYSIDYGSWDGFVISTNLNGTRLYYAQVLGGGGHDHADAIDIDASGCAYVVGWSQGRGFPLSPDAYNKSFGDNKGFVTKLNPNGTVNYSTSIDGWGWGLFEVVVNENGTAYLGGSLDTTLRLVNHNGSDVKGVLDYHTRADDIVITDYGYMYILGYANRQEYPTTEGAYDRTHNGKGDIYLVKASFDETPPWIANETILGQNETGSELTFNVTVMDDWALDTVEMEYWYGTSAKKTRFDMALTNGTLRNSTWEGTFTLPLHSTSELHYKFILRDYANNKNTTTTRDIPLRDSIKPGLEDFTPDTATTGDPFNFRVEVIDNIGIGAVHVRYWFGTDIDGLVNATMVGVDVTGLGNGTYEHHVSEVPSNSIEPLHYLILAQDLRDTWNRTLDTDVLVLDDDDPSILEDRSSRVASTGDPFRFEFNISDNVGIAEVVLTLRFGDGENVSFPLDALDTSPVGNGTYAGEVTVPANATEKLFYTVTVNDTSGNEAHSHLQWYDVQDNDAPRIIEDGTNETGVKGWSFSFRIRVRDNLNVSGAYINYWMGDTASDNLSMDHEDGWFLLEIHIPRQPEAALLYTFYVRDDAGNWNATERRGVLLVNLLPTVSEPPSWELTEGIAGTYDLEPLLGDGNDPTKNLTVVCTDENVTVDGLVLSANFTEWVEDFTIDIVVSDGEDGTPAQIPVTVIDVNDPPVITTRPPGSMEAREDEVFRLDLDAFDVEGEALTWSDDTSLFDIDEGTGVLEFVPGQEEVGDYVINITVSDKRGGSDSVVLNLSVLNVNDPPVIVILTPVNGSTFKEGSEVVFAVEVKDDDGDNLSYSWTELGILSRNATFTTDGLGVGIHTIIVKVDDGSGPVEGSTTIEITRSAGPDGGDGDNGDGGDELSVALVVGVLCIVVAVVAVTVLLKHKGR